MNKPFKRFIALGLTISLASVPTLNEVSKANEVSGIQDISLLSTEIDEAMQSVKIDQLSMDDFSLTILEQPDIVDLEVMEDLPKHQQTMREDAEDYLKDIKPEFIDLTERSILVAEYMSAYHDYFVDEIEKVQEKKSSEDEVKKKIKDGLEDLTTIIEGEKAEVTDTQKEIEGFLVNLEEDYEVFEAGVEEAREYVVEKEDATDEEMKELEEKLKNERNNREIFLLIGVGGVFLSAVALFSSISIVRVPVMTRMTDKLISSAVMRAAPLNGPDVAKIIAGFTANTTVKNGTTLKLKLNNLRGGGALLSFASVIGGFFFAEYTKSKKKIEDLEGLKAELAAAILISDQGDELVETTKGMITSLHGFKSGWNTLQNNIQTMSDVMHGENLTSLKIQFEESSLDWESIRETFEIYQQRGETEILPDPIEIDIDEIDTEEEFEEALKEAYDVDELINIDISDMTEEELEELLRELLEEELDEAA